MEKIPFQFNGHTGYVNLGRLEEVTLAIIQHFRNQRFPFNQAGVLPDLIVPEGIEEGSLEHSLYLFHACSLDSRRRSDLVYSSFSKMVSSGRINLRRLHESSISYLKEVFLEDFSQAGVGGSINPPWKIVSSNSFKLHNERRGDPRKLQERGVQETIDNLRLYSGIGQGIASLILKNYVRFGMWPFPTYEIPPKIDRHIERIALGTEILELPSEVSSIRHDVLRSPLQEGFREVQKRNSLSGIEVDDAFYGLGSKLCVRNQLYYCGLCPTICGARPFLNRSATTFEVNKEVRSSQLPLPF